MLASTVALMSTTALTSPAMAEAPPAPDPVAFSFDILAGMARDIAGKPYVAPDDQLPASMKGLDYDAYRKIAYRPDHAKWADANSPFQIHAFHMGWLFKEPVAMYEVADGKATPMQFSAADFRYQDPDVAASIASGPWPGIAGFRIHFPLNKPDVLDELISFLGASYFRALGRGSIYGLSARGLVINSWVEGPEEFPRFSAFYLERPDDGTTIVVNALLEGPSVAGAYRFEITPGNDHVSETVINVTARLFFRADVKEIGIAPLTSMFLFAANNRSAFDDYREQVHDSSGLMIEQKTGEVIWRPLNNPPGPANSYLWEDSPRSFGLFQRDRAFSNYEDTGAQYERRPSVKIEPLDDWGQGHVRLIEIPSKLEADDNIGAFWIPAAPVTAGTQLEFRYRMRWGDLRPDENAPLAYVEETRAGQGGVSGVANAASLRKFVVDFKGGPLAKWNPDTPPDIVATVSGGTLKVSTIERIADNGMWRLVLDVEAQQTEIMELKAYLVGQGKQLTETWIYQWRAQA